MPLFSLIVPSIQRVAEVADLFASLAEQTCRNFEVILVDQNPDGRLIPLIEQYSSQFPIQHIRQVEPGAARARNAGFRAAHGQFILWPDDDCWYPSDLLARTQALFERRPDLAGAIGILVDETGLPHTRWTPRHERLVSLMDVFTNGAEPALIFRREVVVATGGFDDSLGTGAQTPWGAGEGTDLCVRALQSGQKLGLVPELTIFHKRADILEDEQAQWRKPRAYARGMGAVLKKNRLNPSFIATYFLIYIRALVWAGLHGRWNDTSYHWVRIQSLVEGWRRY